MICGLGDFLIDSIGCSNVKNQLVRFGNTYNQNMISFVRQSYFTISCSGEPSIAFGYGNPASFANVGATSAE